MFTGDMIWLSFMLNALCFPSIALDQRTRATLFLDESLLKTLRWSNVGSTLVQRMYKEKLAPS